MWTRDASQEFTGPCDVRATLRLSESPCRLEGFNVDCKQGSNVYCPEAVLPGREVDICFKNPKKGDLDSTISTSLLISDIRQCVLSLKLDGWLFSLCSVRLDKSEELISVPIGNKPFFRLFGEHAISLVIDSTSVSISYLGCAPKIRSLKGLSQSFQVGIPIRPLRPVLTANLSSLVNVFSVSPFLPDGISLDSKTGVISGTPLVAYKPQHEFVLTLTSLFSGETVGTSCIGFNFEIGLNFITAKGLLVRAKILMQKYMEVGMGFDDSFEKSIRESEIVKLSENFPEIFDSLKFQLILESSEIFRNLKISRISENFGKLKNIFHVPGNFLNFEEAIENIKSVEGATLIIHGGVSLVSSTISIDKSINIIGGGDGAVLTFSESVSLILRGSRNQSEISSLTLSFCGAGNLRVENSASLKMNEVFITGGNVHVAGNFSNFRSIACRFHPSVNEPGILFSENSRGVVSHCYFPPIGDAIKIERPEDEKNIKITRNFFDSDPTFSSQRSLSLAIKNIMKN